MPWRTSSLTGKNGQCVEFAPLPDGAVAMRDTKNRERGMLCFNQREWAAFLGGAKLGEFDDL